MTEKNYGGASSTPQPKNFGGKNKSADIEVRKSREEEEDAEDLDIDVEKLKKAGQILREAKEFAKGFVKKDMKLLEIAEKIEAKIVELGGKPAFPVNLSINEVAAHSTPSYNDESKAFGLLKVDVGVHIDGWAADSAFSVDLENSEENKKLIETAENALKKAVEKFNLGVELGEIGKIIEDEVKSKGFQPIVNLSGHSISQWNLHSGLNIPNYDNHQDFGVEEGVHAIEPFVTTGSGRVRDGRGSGIYSIEKDGQVRDAFAREVLSYVADEYQTLPFCSRWLVKKFGTRALIALKRIEDAGILHQYPQLIEVSGAKVAQAEHTVVLIGKEKIVTT